MPTESTCKSCGAPIRWVKMVRSGKAHPCDAQGEKMVVESLTGGYVAMCYRSHFATCPQADQHRTG